MREGQRDSVREGERESVREGERYRARETSVRRSSPLTLSAEISRAKCRTVLSCIPHCFRPSHHRSYAALFRKPRKSEMATPSAVKEFIDYTTSMITDKDPLRGLLFYWDLGLSLTLHVLKERRRRCEHL